ncbi:mortality factor 4-like protein 1 [Halichondria panicea]|uniref:mortality factor 4-like protein 1 n=1 Tax=Halichondria panicea TaxID=6063 RepID=UPI00312B7B3D
MLILEQTEIGQTHLSFWQTSSSAICTQETLISPHCTATALTLQELKRMLINTWFAFRRWSSHHRLKFYLPRKGRGQKTERSLPNIEMHPDFKMPPKYKFAEGEKVLCYHGPMLYEAKVTKVQVKDKVPQFLVHYSGWNKTWDEWVPESRALKYNDANLQKQKELQQQHPDKKRPTKKKEKPKKEAEPISSRRKRPRLADPVGSPSIVVESVESREIKISIPEELRKWLVDDWDLVTRQKQLVRLPKRETVSDVLQRYSDHAAKTDPDKATSGQIEEVCVGLTGYFNAMLGSQLLYKFERPQYEEILKAHPNKAMSEIYGMEHFLRLFGEMYN